MWADYWWYRWEKGKTFLPITVESQIIYDVLWFTYDEISHQLFIDIATCTFIASHDWIKVFFIFHSNRFQVSRSFATLPHQEKFKLTSGKCHWGEKFKKITSTSSFSLKKLEFDLKTWAIKLGPPWTFYHFKFKEKQQKNISH